MPQVCLHATSSCSRAMDSSYQSLPFVYHKTSSSDRASAVDTPPSLPWLTGCWRALSGMPLGGWPCTSSGRPAWSPSQVAFTTLFPAAFLCCMVLVAGLQDSHACNTKHLLLCSLNRGQVNMQHYLGCLRPM